jgi:hypothetical protein
MINIWFVYTSMNILSMNVICKHTNICFDTSFLHFNREKHTHIDHGPNAQTLDEMTLPSKSKSEEGGNIC